MNRMKLHLKAFVVLILVLMEDTLRESPFSLFDLLQQVLILVLMEDTLRESNYI